MDQVHELQILMNKFRDLKVVVSDTMQVGAIIGKLPPSWNDYRKKLMHITKDFTIEKIPKHLRMETWICDKIFFATNSFKVNYVDSKNHFGGWNKRQFNDINSSINSTNKKSKMCYNCGKKGHLKHEWRNKKKQNKDDHKVPNDENLVKKETSEIVVMIFKMHIDMVERKREKKKKISWLVVWY